MSIIVPKRSVQDATDTYANTKDFYIKLYHLASKRSVSFKAFVTSWSDKLDSKTNEEQVFGRMDPIATYSGTTRMISLGWTVNAIDKNEAINNLANISTFMKFQYPQYSSKSDMATTITAPPLVKVKFANLITLPGASNTASAKEGGLLAFMDGANPEINWDAGVYDHGRGNIIPKSVSLSANFRILHTNSLGWDENGNPRSFGFPYNIEDNDVINVGEQIKEFGSNLVENENLDEIKDGIVLAMGLAPLVIATGEGIR